MLNELMRLLADLLTSEIMGTPMWAMLEMMSLSSGGMLACCRSLHRFSSVTPDTHSETHKCMQYKYPVQTCNSHAWEHACLEKKNELTKENKSKPENTRMKN